MSSRYGKTADMTHKSWYPRLRPSQPCPDGPSCEKEVVRVLARSGLYSALDSWWLSRPSCALTLALDSAFLFVRVWGPLEEAECLQESRNRWAQALVQGHGTRVCQLTIPWAASHFYLGCQCCMYILTVMRCSEPCSCPHCLLEGQLSGRN